MDITFKNDPLLFREKHREGFVNVNSLIKTDFPLILNGGILNLYSVLVKSLDFTKNLRAIPFCKIETKILESYLSDDLKSRNFLKLRKEIATYCGKKKIKIEIIKKWAKDEIWPFVVIRVVSLLNKNKENLVLANLIKSSKGFRSSNWDYVFNPPKRLKELLNKKHAYLSGCILGDGGFCLENFWSIVDGHKEKVELSYDYLNKIRLIIKELYKLSYIKKPTRRDNKIELIINSKYFGRFINFYFGAPYGKKKNRIEIPKIFKLNKNYFMLYKYFLRGLFDSDGYCNEKNRQISLCSGTLKFLKECHNELIKNNLHIGKIKTSKKGVYSFSVYSESYRDFASKIGFSHPRKKSNLLKHLTKSPREQKCFRIKRENMYGKFVNLKKINNLFIHNLNKEVKELRSKKNLYQKDLARFLNVKLGRINAWETKGSIPFLKFYKIWEINGGNYEELVSFLMTKDVLWSVNSRKGYKVKFPLKIDDSLIYIAKNVKPYNYELRIMKRRKTKKELKDLFYNIENMFLVKIKQKRKEVFNVSSDTCAKFFDSFFDYRPLWNKFSKENLNKLDKKLDSIWY